MRRHRVAGDAENEDPDRSIRLCSLRTADLLNERSSLSGEESDEVWILRGAR